MDQNSNDTKKRHGGRAATGTIIRTKSGRWQAVVRLVDGSRKRIPPFPHGTSEEMAREKARHYAERVRELGLVSASTTEKTAPKADPKSDCQAWVDEWQKAREARRLPSARLTRGHWSNYLKAALGGKHPKTWTRQDFRALSKSLNDKVTAGSITWKSATNIWGTATKMADDACNDVDDALQCRDDNPAEGVRGPTRGAKIAKQYLYPSEFSALVECEAVPLEWRRVFAIAAYSYARLGELLALTWDDVDLTHHVIRITKAIDTVTGELRMTKSKAPRNVPIEAALLPLLVVMRAETNAKGPVVPFPTVEHYAGMLRAQLTTAGVRRPSLHTAGPLSKPIRFHDLRATGITWMAVRGDDPVRIQYRAGHTDLTTTMIYVREIADHKEGFGQPFPVLPDSLLGPMVTPNGSPPRAQKTKADVLCAGLSSELWAMKDSNPLKQEGSERLPGNPRCQDSDERADDDAKSLNDGCVTIDGVTAADPVEAALVAALEGATKAGEWLTVAQLARELEERRKARSGVVDLAAVRAAKNGGAK